MSPFDASADAKKDREDRKDTFRDKHRNQINGSDAGK
jgi:hypothetical protein